MHHHKHLNRGGARANRPGLNSSSTGGVSASEGVELPWRYDGVSTSGVDSVASLAAAVLPLHSKVLTLSPN